MDKIESIVINDSGFAFDPFNGQTYTINDIGVMIIRTFRTQQDLVKIARDLTAEYDISFEKAYTDLLEFRNQLKLYGLMD